MERPLICCRKSFDKDNPAADEQRQGTSEPKIEYRTAKAAFPTSHPKEQERRFFYALMLRSRGKKSLDLCGFQSAEPDKQGKDTFPLKIRVLLRNKSTAKELISYGSFQSGTEHGIYRNE